MSRATLTTVGPKFQVCVPKPVRDALGLKTGDLLEASAERGAVVLRPKQLTDKPIPEAAATPAELRSIKRGRRDYLAGNTVTLDEYERRRATKAVDRPTGARRRKAAR